MNKFIALFLLVLLAPIFFIIAILVLLFLGRPIFFRQLRTGLNGSDFVLIKFRTMKNLNPEALGIKDSDRLVPFGALLRKSSLDELPELINIMKGDMNFIGPRPLLPEYIPLYSERQSKRHLVKPGLTGLAQVQGRNDISWQEKFELDVYYVEHRSLKLNILILLKTITTIIGFKGIDSFGQVGSDKFRGDQ
jgi:lipopolysaccharide/colanic/teichoic acid biosynthesis glycosyltransferase